LRPSNLFVEDGSYVRLKQFMLGYTLPKALTTSIGIENLRVYLSGNNLLTLTKYRGMDPEIGNTDTDDERSIAVDRGFYPVSKQLIIGLNLSF